MTTSDRLLTASEAARMLRLAPREIDRMARRGEIPAVHLPGGEVRYDATDLAEWVESHKHPVTEGRSDDR